MQQQTKKKSLRKKILLGFAAIIGIGIIGSQFGDNNVNKPKAATASTESRPEVQKIGDQIEVGNFSYRINKAAFAKKVGNEYLQKTADGYFLVINVSFRNNDAEAHTLDNSFFKLTDESGTEFESSTEGSMALEMEGNETLFLKQCNPKIIKSGLLVFEVPEKGVYDLHLSGGMWSGKTAVVKLAAQ